MHALSLCIVVRLVRLLTNDWAMGPVLKSREAWLWCQRCSHLARVGSIFRIYKGQMLDNLL